MRNLAAKSRKVRGYGEKHDEGMFFFVRFLWYYRVVGIPWVTWRIVAQHSKAPTPTPDKPPIIHHRSHPPNFTVQYICKIPDYRARPPTVCCTCHCKYTTVVLCSSLVNNNNNNNECYYANRWVGGMGSKSVGRWSCPDDDDDDPTTPPMGFKRQASFGGEPA